MSNSKRECAYRRELKKGKNMEQISRRKLVGIKDQWNSF